MTSFKEFSSYFPYFHWNYTPESILERAKSRIESSKNVINKVLALKDNQINFENVIKPMAFEEGRFSRDQQMNELLNSVSPDPALRNATNEASKLFSAFDIEVSMRKDIYDLVNKVRNVEKSLPYESERYLKKILLYKKRDGLHLPEDKRKKLEALFKEISTLCIDFERNMAEEDVKLEFSEEELKGMTTDYLSSLGKSGSKYIVTLKYPDVVPLLKQCQVVRTRQIVEKAFNSRCITTNVPILEKVLKLRFECCQILGYPTHADYVTEILMSKNSQNVREFLETLSIKLQTSFEQQMSRLIELKQEECEKFDMNFDGKINPYDFTYYQRMVEERDFSVDHNLIKQYFPFKHVCQKTMDIYQILLHLKFNQVKDPMVWDPEVTLFSVHDSDTGNLYGYFYLDLFPRPGKYTHAACFGLQASYQSETGHQLACAAMVANFTKPLPEKPSLLTHDEVLFLSIKVITFFHEFGHVMHQICSSTQFSFFHGTSVERDFVEAPSQMLENWGWELESLKLLSHHYKCNFDFDLAGKSLDDDTICKLIQSRISNIALRYRRQITLSFFDLMIHTIPDVIYSLKTSQILLKLIKIVQ